MINLHIINDEKITLQMINLFEMVKKDSDENHYLIFSKTSEIKYKKSNDNLFYSFDKWTSKILYDTIVIHGLDYPKVRFVNKNITYNTKFIWLLWGGEIYNRPEIYSRLFNIRTKKLLLLINPKKEIPRFLSNWFRGNLGKMREIKEFTKKIDVIGTTLINDYELAKTIFNITPEFKSFNFYFFDDEKKNDSIDRVKQKSNSILLGNSGHPSNNHLDVIKEIEKNKYFKSFQIIIPLSYGPKFYINSLVKGFKIKNKNRIIPLLSFLNYEEYMEILTSVKLAVFGFTRQQGFGNIVALLNQGIPVFLENKNPMLSYFRNLGIKIFDLNELSSIDPENLLSMNLEENRNIIQEKFSVHIAKDLANNLFL